MIFLYFFFVVGKVNIDEYDFLIIKKEEKIIESEEIFLVYVRNVDGFSGMFLVEFFWSFIII